MSFAYISPDSMTHLASDAAVSVNLVWKGYSDEAVRAGLEKGVQFCQILRDGISEQGNRSRFFSAQKIAAEGFVTWAMKLDDLKSSISNAELATVKNDLQQLTKQVQSGQPPRLNRERAKELYEFFNRFSRTLAHQAALSRRAPRRAGA
ncbi:hypothetical protein EG829_09225 [bacterium]|nr:hypothetical protein [bacterium]